MMIAAALVGIVIHGLEARELDTMENPTRSLDVILLMGAALGQIGISYFSIVAIVATKPSDLLNSIILAYSVSLIIQHITQNIFIIEGLHRQPLMMDESLSRSTQRSISTQSQADEPMASYGGQEPFPSTTDKETKTKGEMGEESSLRAYTLEIKQEIRRVSQAYIQTYNHLNWKRKALKEISSFLIMCNIIVST